MVPSAFVTLERLPLTPNGKLDRRALPAPVVAANVVRRLPRTPHEEVLCGLFAETLGVAEVGIDDNFFELGGDSIMSIQLVSRARRAGLSITPRAVFQHQTVATLAAVAGARQETAAPAPDIAAGALPATPIMRWLAERGGPIDRFSQAMLLNVPAALDADHLSTALQNLLDHHAALRLRLDAAAHEPAAASTIAAFTCPAVSPSSIALASHGGAGGGGRRRPVCAGSRSRGSTRRRGRRVIAEEAQRGGWAACAVRGRDAAGGLVRCRPEVSGRLLLVIHHLAVDGVSWRILLPDLEAAVTAAVRGEMPALPAAGSSFRRWAQALATEAQSAERLAELPLWTAIQDAPALSLFDGALDRARDVTGSAGELTLTLPPAVTGALLTRVAAAFHAGINDVLLTALALAVVDWCRRRGRDGAQNAVLVDVEGHGREEFGAGSAGSICRARSAGSPASTRYGSIRGCSISTPRSRAVTPSARALKTIKEQLRALPDRGLGYGLLRYLNPQTAPGLAQLATPQIGFNYLGRFAAPRHCRLGERARGCAARRRRSGAGAGARHRDQCADARRRRRPEPCRHLDLGAFAISDAMVRDLAQGWFRALEALVRHADRPDAGGRTPSDLPLVQLTQGEIEEIEQHYRRLDDILPLAPLQEGLLFHALYDAQAPDVYTIQLQLGLAGALDGDALAQAAHALIERHAGLRAGFRQAGLGRPVQVIVPDATPRWTRLDLSGLDETDRMRRLGEIAAAERAERFDLAAPPLIRFALVRLTAEDHRLILTGHHILLDGWSLPVLVRELMTLYARQAEGGNHRDVTAAPDAVPRLSGLDRRAGPRRRPGGLAGRPGRTAGTDLSGAARPRPPARHARAGRTGAERGTDRRVEPAGTRPGAHPQQLYPGRLGDPARPADRT